MLALYVGDRGLAEELAQEALIRLCQHWPRVRRMERPGGWLTRVAMNLARSSWRRRAAEHQRRALVLRYYAQRSVAEVAVEMGCAETLALVRLWSGATVDQETSAMEPVVERWSYDSGEWARGETPPLSNRFGPRWRSTVTGWESGEVPARSWRTAR